FKLIAWMRGKAGSGFWGTLLDCFYCLSIWIAIPFAILMGNFWWQKFLLWPSLSAAAILLNRVVDRIAPDAPVYFESPPEKMKEKVWVAGGSQGNSLRYRQQPTSPSRRLEL